MQGILSQPPNWPAPREGRRQGCVKETRYNASPADYGVATPRVSTEYNAPPSSSTPYASPAGYPSYALPQPQYEVQDRYHAIAPPAGNQSYGGTSYG
ncbi:uncharacterized protein J3R85_010335 [Psidium guajava]|nr:uncharacterized protein J3R85_010335 [Psidium guajava]